MLLKLKQIKIGLLKKSKVTKYFLYAIGEIFLIVVGILVALHFNNMNLARLSSDIELQYYQIINDQLAEDRAILTEEANHALDRKQAYSVGKKIISGDIRDRSDELALIMLRLIDYGDFRRSSSVYQALISSGEVKYIKNKEIIDGLHEIERTYEIIERLERTQANVVMTHTAPVILQMTDLERGEIIDQDLAFTRITSNRFEVAIMLVDEKLLEFSNAVMIIDNLAKIISDELDR